jgi:hypothetical protein
MKKNHWIFFSLNIKKVSQYMNKILMKSMKERQYLIYVVEEGVLRILSEIFLKTIELFGFYQDSHIRFHMSFDV